MKSNALIVMLAVALPVAAVGQTTPSPSVSPTPSVTVTPVPSPSPTPSPGKMMAVCTVTFRSATPPTTPGGPSALHERQYPLENYGVKTTGMERYVLAVAPTTGTFVADMQQAVSSKYKFLAITFMCNGQTLTADNTIVSSAKPSGAYDEFTVPLSPLVKFPPRLPPDVPNPRSHVNAPS